MRMVNPNRSWFLRIFAQGGVFFAVLFGLSCADRLYENPVDPGFVPQGMVLVDGGTFQMGSTTGNSDEQPVHSVTLSSFYIDKYEVTVAQYRAFCTATGRTFPSAPSWGWNDTDPMVNVSWNDARDYAAWAGKRLLTEARWEYAARGGIKSQGYTYSGSNTLDEVGWYASNSSGRAHTVGTKKANELGIFDMSGNVWEWCSDWYGPYSSGAVTNPTGPATGTYPVLRGGALYIDGYYCRVAFRGIYVPTVALNSVGFRCARDF